MTSLRLDVKWLASLLAVAALPAFGALDAKPNVAPEKEEQAATWAHPVGEKGARAGTKAHPVGEKGARAGTKAHPVGERGAKASAITFERTPTGKKGIVAPDKGAKAGTITFERKATKGMVGDAWRKKGAQGFESKNARAGALGAPGGGKSDANAEVVSPKE
jgi:hypothetical protein